MERRDFLKLSTLLGTSAALHGCANPAQQLIRFIPEEDLVPGVAVWKPSICPACPAGLPDWRSQLYDPEVADGKILVGAVNIPEARRGELETRPRQATAGPGDSQQERNR